MLHHIEHRFIAGIRFDAQLAYEARNVRKLSSAGASTYEALPTLRLRDPQQALLVSILQAAAILTGMRRRDLLGLMRRQLNALASEPLASDSGADAAISMVKRSGVELASQHIVLDSTTATTQWKGLLAPYSLHLVRVRGLHAHRWSLIVGVEHAQHAASRDLRALLLLDSQASEPWASGFNARLELEAGSGLSLGRAANPTGLPLAYRGLDGEAEPVALCDLIELQPRAKAVS